ncbi:hypothetical protein Pla123a_46630 [Posidoniimonas polymericola]|uniref:Uncharacterized protein n=1 Tax=Posidoniimonas polymericola TaxID=2528002 RepID=A0A5C5XV21_9BACT|nr:hypothetical protein [Posidoniimonas polymericola]TWT66774.1 hypothetical protein Pla123a_46630 [Posidoniimonas polymericola]
MANQSFPIRAQSDSRFYRRFILMGLGALGFAGWCVYDGAIGWPQKNAIWEAYEAIPEKDRPEEWPTVAAENGWSAEKPNEHDYHHTDAQMQMQYYMAVPIALVGLWFLSGVVRARGSWIEGTAEGVTSSWGQSFNWSDVEQVDKKKWRNKGIAKVKYAKDGRKRTFVIDDYKFMRDPTDAIMLELEDRVPREAIVNGPTEKEVAEGEATAGGEVGQEST